MGCVLASIALCQLDKVARHAEIRRRQFAAYDDAVAELPGITPLARDDRDVHALHLYVVRVPDRNRVQQALTDLGIQTSVHYPPVHRFSYYRDQTLELPRAEEIAARVVTLPLHPKLTDADVDIVCDALLERD